MIKKEMECGRNSDVENPLAIVENGFSRRGNSGGSSKETLRTYKRRKCTKMNSSQAKVLENGNITVETFRLFPEKPSFQTRGHVDKFHSLGGVLTDRTQKSGRGPLGVTCNGSSCKSSCSNTDSCEQVLLDIVKSKEFTQLRDILGEDFQGTKVDGLRDIHHIKLKLKEGAYENSPMLFHSDVQKIWEHLQKVGTDIVSLSKSLMDKSKASLSQQFSGSNLGPKLEQIEACGVSSSFICRHCGEKAEGKNSLICNLCEEMYHFSCIEPAIEEIPAKSWYCTNCLATGIESPHDNCVACVKLIVTNGLSNYENQLRKDGDICNICKTEVISCQKFKICGREKVGTDIVSLSKTLMDKSNASSLQFCGSNLVPKLEETEICGVSNSCTCFHCGEKAEGNNSLICDSCEGIYHVSCIEPPIQEIPTNNWYCNNCTTIGIESTHDSCVAVALPSFEDTNGLSSNEIELRKCYNIRKCDVGIQKIAKARREYERIHIKRKT